MDKVKKLSQNAPLPYVDFLAKVFEYFQGSSKDEECIKLFGFVIHKEMVA